MRRRKNNDKRVLVSPREIRSSSNKRRFRRNNRNNNFNSNPRRGDHKPKKTNGLTLLLMILALVAFIAGAGFGISLSLDDGSDDGPHVVNVTKEMTTNLNNTTPVYFDEELDDIDFNDNETLAELNITETPSY